MQAVAPVTKVEFSWIAKPMQKAATRIKIIEMINNIKVFLLI